MPNQNIKQGIVAQGERIPEASLSEAEKARLEKFFDRSLRFHERDNIRENLFAHNVEEISLAARIAKKEFDEVSFGGENPDSGFGMNMIQSGYFGWNSWDAMGSATNFSTAISGGSVNNLIDADTPDNLASGSGGGSSDPMEVGKPAVHLILGIGSFSTEANVLKAQYEVNRHPQVPVCFERHSRNSEVRLRELNMPRLLLPGNEFWLGGWVYSADINDPIYLEGVSFIEADELKTANPADMAGSDSENIATY